MTAATDVVDVAALMQLSDERDRWELRLIEAERRGYQRGLAAAAVRLAEIESRREAVGWWREYAARVRELQTPAGVRIERAAARIRSDARELESSRTQLAAVVRAGVRFADPGDAS